MADTEQRAPDPEDYAHAQLDPNAHSPVFREAGATVRWQAKLRNMNVTVSANDERAIEVLASGLPLFQGAQLAVDITIRSVLTASGAAVPNTSHTDGVVLLQARREKEGAQVCRTVGW